MYVTVVPSGISGLGYYGDFLSPEEGRRCMSIVDGNEWVTEIKRRQQVRGGASEVRGTRAKGSGGPAESSHLL
jgi:hypothetical protein